MQIVTTMLRYCKCHFWNGICDAVVATLSYYRSYYLCYYFFRKIDTFIFILVENIAFKFIMLILLTI